MSNKSFWTSPDDFDNDVLAISDFCDSTLIKQRPPPPSIHTKKARSRPSMYDDDDDPFDNRVVRPECRGRGHDLQNGYLRKPGDITSFLRHQQETSKEIREVAGFGYSNELIEHSLRGQAEETQPKKYEMPNIRLTPVPKSGTSSSAPTSLPPSSNGLERKVAIVENDITSPTFSAPVPPLTDILKKSKPNEFDVRLDPTVAPFKPFVQQFNDQQENSAAFFMKKPDKSVSINQEPSAD